MDVPMLMSSIAAYGNSLPIDVTFFDEPPANLEDADMPAVVLFWDGEEATIITPNTDQGDMWDVTIRARLYGAAKEGNTEAEFAAVSRYITPIVAAINGGNPNRYLQGLSGQTVDRLRATRVLGSLEVGYAGKAYYGADIFLNSKFHLYYDEES